MSTEATIEQLKSELRSEFADVLFEFSLQMFQNHVELWVYVLSISQFEVVKQRCREIERERQLDDHEPEIWLIVKTWSGAWSGGDSETEIRKAEMLERRRDEVRLKVRVANAAT